MNDNSLLVNEIFGPTWQGEGQSTGKLCYFIRLSHCNQSCVFCDTFYTWAFDNEKIKGHLYAKEPVNVKDEVHKMTTNEIFTKLLRLSELSDKKFLHFPLIVISGGEPMLQSKKLISLIDTLFSYVDRFEIETAGTIFDPDLMSYANSYGKIFFNVSPKLQNSGNPKHIRYKPDVLREFNDSNRATFKFVVSEVNDFEEIDQIVKDIGINRTNVYIMPEGLNEKQLSESIKKIAPFVLRRRWNLTNRLHVQIFGNSREEKLEK